MLGVGALVSWPLVAIGAASLAHCDQPRAYCETTSVAYATRLIEKNRVESATGACAALGPASFDADPEVSFGSYYPKDDKGQPDYSKGSVAVQTAEISALLAAAQGNGMDNQATDGKQYSLGPFTAAQADDKGFCTAPTLSKTHLVLPASGMSPAVDIELTWSNVQVYVTAATIGTQVQADLVDKRVTSAGTCTITYRVLSLAPAVPCSIPGPEGGSLMNPDGSFQTNLEACDPQPNPDAGMFLGSGIGPTTAYTCDPTIGWCTIKGDSVPALQ
jgi:hypothetical protein